MEYSDVCVHVCECNVLLELARCVCSLDVVCVGFSQLSTLLSLK